MMVRKRNRGIVYNTYRLYLIKQPNPLDATTTITLTLIKKSFGY